MRIPKTFLNYFLSYIIIFCIPTILLATIFYSHVIEQFEITTFNIEQSEQQKKNEMIDNNFEQLKNIAYQFSMQSSVNADTLKNDVNERMLLIKQLQSFLVLTTGVDEIIFWLPEQDLFYSSLSSYSSHTYVEIFNVDLAEVLMENNTTQTTAISLVPQMYVDTEEQEEILYFSCPYPYNSVRPSGQLVFKINVDKFIPVSEKDFALLYRDQVLLNHLELSKDDILVSEFDAIVDIDAQNTLIPTQSTMNSFRLLTVTDKQDIFDSFYQTKRLFLTLMILVSVLSVTAVSIFTYKNYKPIYQLDTAMAKLNVAHQNSPKTSTEISRAIASMEMLSSQNRQLDEQLVEETYTSRSLWLSRLLTSEGRDLPRILGMLKRYGIVLNSPYYTIAIIRTEPEVQVNVYFDEVVFSSSDGQMQYYIDARNQIVVILGTTNNNRADLQAQLSEIGRGLTEIGLSWEIYGGDTYSGLDKLYASYVDAQMIMTEEKNCTDKVYLYNAKNANRYFFYPHIELKRLEASLEKRDTAEIQEIISTIVFELERAVYKDFMGKTVCYEVANLCIRAFEGREEYGDCMNILGQFVLELNNTNARKDFCILLQRLGEELGQILLAKEPAAVTVTQGETLSAQILEYIHSNYTDAGFYLGEVAEKFHISQNNLSQQLKRNLGVSPAKYINNLRIEQAKNLLVTTEDSIKEIAAKVGFTDDSSFIRKFKGMTSLTPNQYRTTYREKKG